MLTVFVQQCVLHPVLFKHASFPQYIINMFVHEAVAQLVFYLDIYKSKKGSFTYLLHSDAVSNLGVKRMKELQR